MKKLLFVLFASLSISGFAQQSAQLKDNFIVSSAEKVVFTIHLTTDISEAQLSELNQWSRDNQQFFSTTVKGRTVIFDVQKEKFDRNIIAKAFYFLEIDKLITPKGNTLSLEEFFNENKL